MRCGIDMQCVGATVIWVGVGGELIDSYSDHVPVGGDNLIMTVRSIS